MGDTDTRRGRAADAQHIDDRRYRMTDKRAMTFFLPITPPTATAQERQSTITRSGKRVHYKNARLQAAEDLLTWALAPHAPSTPLDGPLRLDVGWYYPSGKSHHSGEWRATRPDTDNLSKMLKDIMTRLRFWHDDAQVCHETVSKVWSDHPGIQIEISEMDKMMGVMDDGR